RLRADRAVSGGRDGGYGVLRAEVRVARKPRTHCSTRYSVLRRTPTHPNTPTNAPPPYRDAHCALECSEAPTTHSWDRYASPGTAVVRRTLYGSAFRARHALRPSPDNPRPADIGQQLPHRGGLQPGSR